MSIATNKGADQPAQSEQIPLLCFFDSRLYTDAKASLIMLKLDVNDAACFCGWGGWFEFYLVGLEIPKMHFRMVWLNSKLYWGAQWLIDKLEGLWVRASAKALRCGFKQILDLLLGTGSIRIWDQRNFEWYYNCECGGGGRGLTLNGDVWSFLALIKVKVR